jgi:hypothetical protein
MEQGDKMRVKRWLKEMPALAIIGTVLFGVLAVGGSLLVWGSNFAQDMVHNQLAAQKIVFPAKGAANFSPKEFPGLQRYAGQAVDSGPKAKAYANQFINVHLQGIGGGKTYSQLSAESMANPNDAKLAGQVATVFKGETLRGLLLYAWGWSVVGLIAYWVGIAAFLGAIGVGGALVISFLMHEKHVKAEEKAQTPGFSATPAAVA